MQQSWKTIDFAESVADKVLGIYYIDCKFGEFFDSEISKAVQTWMRQTYAAAPGDEIELNW